MEKLDFSSNTPEEKPSYEGVTTEKVTVKNEHNLVDLLSYDHLHINKEILADIEKEGVEISNTEVDTHRYSLSDEMYDSSLFEKLHINPYSMEEFLTTLSALVQEENQLGSQLNSNGTRDKPPFNVFFVNNDGKTQNFTLWQDKDSDGNTFLHWYLNKIDLGQSKLTPGTVVFSK